LFDQKNILPDNKEPFDKTFLGKDASFKGELSFSGTLCIDGKFEGQINTSGTLIISKSGDIEANINAETVICEGHVKGDITASKKVELRSNSKVTGDVQSPSLNIEVGAKLDGKCDMSKRNNHAAKPS
jgi:cytoskeletal protein CcmA (bactofilin family)